MTLHDVEHSAVGVTAFAHGVPVHSLLLASLGVVAPAQREPGNHAAIRADSQRPSNVRNLAAIPSAMASIPSKPLKQSVAARSV